MMTDEKDAAPSTAAEAASGAQPAAAGTIDEVAEFEALLADLAALRDEGTTVDHMHIDEFKRLRRL